MTAYDHRRRYRDEPPFARDSRRTASRFWAYLRSRRTECWVFFAAGFLIASILT
ncbi:hypothetical protein [Inquilinus sp. CAU 1745]|uniref:hypothetical protein n=1 Tax=Inquilinus sp. CAU 1745 TaxID=3140369 RepID=UPI00325A4830